MPSSSQGVDDSIYEDLPHTPGDEKVGVAVKFFNGEPRRVAFVMPLCELEHGLAVGDFKNYFKHLGPIKYGWPDGVNEDLDEV